MAHLREKKGNYYAEFYDPQRQPKRKWVTLRTRDKSAAQSRLHDLQRKYSAGAYDPWQDPAEMSLTVTEAKEKFLQAKDHLAQATLQKYKLVIRQLIDAVSKRTPLRKVTASDLEAVYLRDSLSDYSKYTYYRHVHVFIQWALDEGYLKDNPFDRARTPQQVKREKTFLTPEDVTELLSAIEAKMLAEDRDLQWLHDIVQVAITTGLRLSELVNMKWSWIDFDTAILTIRTDEFKSKSGHEDSVPLVDDALQVLRRRQEESTGQYVFWTDRTDQISRSWVSHAFKDFVREAGLDERISFHSLRHTCASWMVMRGVPLTVVQRVLRHSQISVTEGYAHLAPEVMRSHMDRAFGSTDENQEEEETESETVENGSSM
jgi:site-specific recombinase XerD